MYTWLIKNICCTLYILYIYFIHILYFISVWKASACHTETPTHVEIRTHNQCGDTTEKSQAPDNGCINIRNMLSIEEVK